MFGIRIAIGAVDKTTKTTQDVAQKLQKFGSKINSLINLGGIVIAFRKVGQAIDKAFNASTYSKEWGDFKDTFSQGFADIAGRVADSWGPMLDTAKQWADSIVGAFDKVVDRIQYAGAYMGALLSGEGFSGAAKIAQQTVDALKREREERKKIASQIKAIEQSQQQVSSKTNITQQARQQAEYDLAMLKESGGDTSYERAPVTMKQRAAARMRGDNRLDYAGRGLKGRLNVTRGFGFRGMGGVGNTETAFQVGMSGMSTEEIEQAAMGPLSGLSGIAKGARDSAKQARKMDRLIAEARRRDGRGRKLSSRMQAALEVDKRREQESRDAQRKQNVEGAIMNLDTRVEQIAQELVGSGAGGK